MAFLSGRPDAGVLFAHHLFVVAMNHPALVDWRGPLRLVCRAAERSIPKTGSAAGPVSGPGIPSRTTWQGTNPAVRCAIECDAPAGVLFCLRELVPGKITGPTALELLLFAVSCGSWSVVKAFGDVDFCQPLLGMNPGETIRDKALIEHDDPSEHCLSKAVDRKRNVELAKVQYWLGIQARTSDEHMGRHGYWVDPDDAVAVRKTAEAREKADMFWPRTNPAKPRLGNTVLQRWDMRIFYRTEMFLGQQKSLSLLDWIKAVHGEHYPPGLLEGCVIADWSEGVDRILSHEHPAAYRPYDWHPYELLSDCSTPLARRAVAAFDDPTEERYRRILNKRQKPDDTNGSSSSSSDGDTKRPKPM